MGDRVNLLGQTEQELEKLVTDLGAASFRASQIFKWIYDKKVATIDEMTNLSKGLRTKLKEISCINQLKIVTSQKSKDGTIKYLFQLEDNQRIEAVYMPYQDGRNSICISTQVGCGMGCTFCATGLQGLSRNLTAGEMINQIITIEKDLDQEITNVVVMGMGEPLANYRQLLKAIKLINHNSGLNIGMRKITVSTCGLVPKIKKLAQEELQLTLAISLHAANNELRSEMMPINNQYPLEELLAACREYIAKTSRRITFEYALVKGVNDSRQDAKQLASLLSGMLAHVNLIPINQVEELDYTKPTKRTIRRFEEELSQENINSTVRIERGADIAAACGQLQAKED